MSGKFVVLGAGKMGKAIAAQLAISDQVKEVVLYDMSAEIAQKAIKGLIDDPKHPLKPEHLSKFKFANSADLEDRKLVAGSELVIEAVIENAQLKKDTYKWVFENADKNTVLASNTSTQPLTILSEEMTPEQKARFILLHFHQPVHLNPMLETAAFPESQQHLNKYQAFCVKELGCEAEHVPHDNAGFLSNREGFGWIASSLVNARKHNITIQEVDKIATSLGIPPTGVGGVVDYIALGTSNSITNTLYNGVKKDDQFAKNYEGWFHETLESMANHKQSFYVGKFGAEDRTMRDLQTGNYIPVVDAKALKIDAVDNAKKGGLNALIETDSKYGAYAKDMLLETLAYHASLVPAVGFDPISVDKMQKSGWGWEKGSFQMIDEVGVDKVIDFIKANNGKVPEILNTVKENGGKFYRVHEGDYQVMNSNGEFQTLNQYKFSDLAPALGKPLEENKDARLWEKAGVLIVDFKTKGNNISAGVLDMVETALNKVEESNGKYKGIVFGNGDKNFAVGADLNVFLEDGKNKNWDKSNAFIKRGQEVFLRLKNANFPKVFMGKGQALGGGSELALHCDYGVVDKGFKIGLVENKVGLIPGWGGTEEMLFRLAEKQQKSGEGGKIDPFLKVFDYLANNTVSKNSKEAKEMGFLNNETLVLGKEKELLPSALTIVQKTAENYQPLDTKSTIEVPIGVKAALSKKIKELTDTADINPHQLSVLQAGAELLGTYEGKKVNQVQLRVTAREIFSRLVSHPAAGACMEHTMKTGERLPTDKYPEGTLTAGNSLNV